jgi:hypothetical protein
MNKDVRKSFLGNILKFSDQINDYISGQLADLKEKRTAEQLLVMSRSVSPLSDRMLMIEPPKTIGGDEINAASGSQIDTGTQPMNTFLIILFQKSILLFMHLPHALPKKFQVTLISSRLVY